jgi:hypothetical protein
VPGRPGILQLSGGIKLRVLVLKKGLGLQNGSGNTAKIRKIFHTNAPSFRFSGSGGKTCSNPSNSAETVKNPDFQIDRLKISLRKLTFQVKRYC